MMRIVSSWLLEDGKVQRLTRARKRNANRRDYWRKWKQEKRAKARAA